MASTLISELNLITLLLFTDLLWCFCRLFVVTGANMTTDEIQSRVTKGSEHIIIFNYFSNAHCHLGKMCINLSVYRKIYLP
jgi:hypothetical protein